MIFIEKGQIDTFIVYLEVFYNFHPKEKYKLNTFLDEYSKLNFHNSKEDLNKKQVIDNVFETLYGNTLEKLIKDFKRGSKFHKIESEESRLRKRVVELEETLEELREAYWTIKQDIRDSRFMNL